MSIIEFVGKMFVCVQFWCEQTERRQYSMAHDILILMYRLSRLLEQQGRSNVSEQFGLTTTQALVLGSLRCRGKRVCATDLHKQLGISKAALSVALKDLGENGYLTVASCPGDDRKKQITLTRKAEKLYTKIRKSMAALEMQACYGLTDDQVEDTRRSLEIILHNLSHPKQDGYIPDGRET